MGFPSVMAADVSCAVMAVAVPIRRRRSCVAPQRLGRTQACGAPSADRAGDESAEHGESDGDGDDADRDGGVQHDLGRARGRGGRAGEAAAGAGLQSHPPAAGSARDEVGARGAADASAR